MNQIRNFTVVPQSVFQDFKECWLESVKRTSLNAAKAYAFILIALSSSPSTYVTLTVKSKKQ